MTTLSKEDVTEQICKIAKMEREEALKYRETISLANIDTKAKSFIYRAIDLVIAPVSLLEDVLAIGSELRAGEV